MRRPCKDPSDQFIVDPASTKVLDIDAVDREIMQAYAVLSLVSGELSQNFPGEVRGWQVAKNIYLGQAKVAKKWGLGLVYERGNTVYGINKMKRI